MASPTPEQLVDPKWRKMFNDAWAWSCRACNDGKLIECKIIYGGRNQGKVFTMFKDLQIRLVQLRQNLQDEEKSCGKDTLYAQDLKATIESVERSLKSSNYKIIG